jgi:putative Ca2+/H+ antiporter (TMEM165/GDT1 family)
MHIATIATVFAVIFIAELPDKSLFASLVLGTRYRALWVWLGVSAAFIVHVTIAVVAGHLLTLLPHRAVEAVVAILFAAGAVLLLLPERGDGQADDAATSAKPAAGVASVILTSFGVVFIGEWGDITQIATANLAAKYDDPVSVGIGAALGLMAVAAVAITAGSTLLRVVSISVVRRVAGVILAVFAVVAAVSLLR